MELYIFKNAYSLLYIHYYSKLIFEKRLESNIVSFQNIILPSFEQISMAVFSPLEEELQRSISHIYLNDIHSFSRLVTISLEILETKLWE